MRWLVLAAVTFGAIYGIGKWLTKPAIDVATFVETPEIRASLHKKWENVVNSPRGTPHVDVDAPESVIRWPAFQSSAVLAPPLELRIRKEQWAAEHPVADVAPIGPMSVRLKLEWPEADEERAKAPAGERPLAVSYFRSPDGEMPDPIHDPKVRAREGVMHASPADAPREQAVLVYCPSYQRMDCDLYFEHLGRQAHFFFPQRRADDWEGGLKAARALLASVASPLERR